MPIYEYSCPECQLVWESFKKMEDRDGEECGCGRIAVLNISCPSRPVVLEYYSENLGGYVTGPAQRRRLMKEKDLVEYDPKDK